MDFHSELLGTVPCKNPPHLKTQNRKMKEIKKIKT